MSAGLTRSQIKSQMSKTTQEGAAATGAAIVIAMSDASTLEKAMVEAMGGIQLDGTADQTDIQTAIDNLTNGGLIEFTSGHAYCTGYITIPASLPFTFQGQGAVTIFSFSRADLSASNRQLFTNYNGSTRNDVSDVHFRHMKFVEENEVVSTSYGDGIGIGDTDGDSTNHNVSVIGCEFDHCGCRVKNVDTGRVIVAGNYIHDIAGNCLNDIGLNVRYCDAPVLIDANTIDTVYDMAIEAKDCTSGLIIRGNTVIDSGQTGTDYAICTDSSVDVQVCLNNVQGRYGIISEDDIGPVLISHNTVSGTTSYGIGIWVRDNGDSSPYQVEITHNTVTNMKYGIEAESVADAIISHNKIRTVAQWGIYVCDTLSVTPRRTQILYNDVYDFADVTAYTAGIYCKVDYADIIGNNIDGNSNSNARGIMGNNATQANVRILDNSILGIGKASNKMYQVGTGAQIERNAGYVTEAKGTSKIDSGATTVNVTHGLSATPTVINVTFAEAGTNDYGRWWISSAGATTFTVNVSSDPGASNLDFWWEAKVR